MVASNKISSVLIPALAKLSRQVSLHLFRERVFLLSGMFLALSVHFKIYPIIYSLPMYASLTDRKGLTGLLFDINQARSVPTIMVCFAQSVLAKLASTQAAQLIIFIYREISSVTSLKGT